jgi:enamine deaminase RidA (YjgF/YER057c/UK114 family)
MTRRLISSDSRFDREVAYSRVVVDGEWAFVSGTTGFDYATMTISGDVAEQTGQTLENITSALQEAGFSLADVVRTTYVLPRAEDFPACWPVLREYLGEIRPANTTLIAAGNVPAPAYLRVETPTRIRSMVSSAAVRPWLRPRQSATRPCRHPA